MNGLTSDSTRLLTEKLALARELATLKPELEHLRCQTTAQQTHLAEKLALQRQMSALEVELENEKRTSKRLAKNETDDDRIREMHSKIESLRQELAKERAERQEEKVTLQEQVKRLEAALGSGKLATRSPTPEDIASDAEAGIRHQLAELQKEMAKWKKEAEKAQKVAAKDSADWNSRKAVLESKLEQTRTKLRSTKDTLKEVETDLVKAQKEAAQSFKAVNTQRPIANKGKLAALTVIEDASIGTPDGVAVRGKIPATRRGKIDQALLGEKSMFSITPFLNRTMSVAPGTPQAASNLESQDAEAHEEIVPTEPENNDASTEGNQSPSVRTRAIPSKKAAARSLLKNSKKSVVNVKVPKRQRTVEALEIVNEEETDENTPPEIVTATKRDVARNTRASTGTTEAAEPKKKKRKLLGAPRTLFDEEEGETTKRPAKVKLGPKALGKVALGGPKMASGGIQNGFGTFSPLKKDRRGAGASFLA